MQGIRLSEWEKLDTVEAHTMQYMRRNETNGRLATLVKTVRLSRGQLPIGQLGTKYSICKHKIVTDIDVFESVAPKHLSINKHKLCPLPVLSFVGRNDILDQMSKYFELDCQSQHMFVLYGLGGSGKSQIGYKFLKDSQASNDKRYVFIKLSNYSILLFTMLISSFSDIFYIDATNEQTLQADLSAIVPGSAQETVDASLQWLTYQHEGHWLLFFDNADEVGLDLGRFIPQSVLGNILVTTRNPDVCTLAGIEGCAKVAGMSSEDSTQLLLKLSCAVQSDESQALAEQIVKVCSFINITKEITYFYISNLGTPLLCFSSLSSRSLYSSLIIIKRVSRALSTGT